MERLLKKICILMVLVLFVGVVSNVVPVTAASAWEFKTKTGITISVNGTIQMKKNEFQDFNLYNNNSEITTSSSKYSVSWSSSDTNIIWIDKVNGKARVDKNKKMTSETGEAVITASIKNNNTGAKITRKFTVTVGSKTNIAKLTIESADGTDFNQTLEVGKDYKLKSVTYDKNGKALTFAQTKLYRTYFGAGITNGTFKADKEGTYRIYVGAYKSKAAAKAATSYETAVVYGYRDIIVSSKSAKMTAIKQITLDSVEITMNDEKYAKELINNLGKLVVYNYTGSYEVKTFIKSITEKSGNNKVVIVTMYSQFTENNNYRFELTSDKNVSITMKSSDLTPSYIKVVGGECKVGDYTAMQVIAYNSDGIEVPISANYTVTYSATKSTDFNVTGNQIFFFYPKKEAYITATLDGYNMYGQKLPSLQGTGIYVSVDEAELIRNAITGFAIGTSANTTIQSKLIYDNAKKTVCIGDNDRMLFISYTGKDLSGKKIAKYIVGGSDSDYRNDYTYISTNTSCLVVSSINGTMVPINPGTADILIMKGRGDQAIQVASVTVEILERRKLTNLVIAPYDDKFSVTRDINTNQSLKLDLSVIDQYGQEMDPTTITYTFEIMHPQGQSFNSCFRVSRDGLDIILKENVGLFNIPVGTIQGYSIEVTAHYTTGTEVAKQVISLAAKTIDKTAMVNTALSMNKNAVDMKLDKEKPEDYNVEIIIKQTDAYGYAIGDTPINYCATPENASRVDGVYSIVIMNGATSSVIPYELKDNLLILKPVKLEGNLIKKAQTGSYIIHLYKGYKGQAQWIQSLPLVLTDSTPQINVEQKSVSINSLTVENIRDAIRFYRNGVDISSYITVDSYEIVPLPLSKTQHVTSINVRINAVEMNQLWSNNLYTSEKIEVGKTFEIIN